VTRPQPALTPAAHADVLHAVQHYSDQRLLLGFEFLDELEHTTELIRQSPLLSTLINPPIRRSLIQRFPTACSSPLVPTTHPTSSLLSSTCVKIQTSFARPTSAEPGAAQLTP
jgi:hypothetical protein